MRALVQRTAHGSVAVNGAVVGKIAAGLVILLGVTHGDTDEDVLFLAEKCVHLRIFEDDAGKMNKSLTDIGGAALIVSQFTLYGDASHGRRPSFSDAAEPVLAEKLYNDFIRAVETFGVPVATGRFGADMKLELLNDGPVTLMVESRKVQK